MTQAQNETYKELKQSGKVKNYYDAILKKLSEESLTINSIKKELKLSKSNVSGRLSELCDKGLVKVERKFKNCYNNWESIYTATYEGERKRLSQKRKYEKIQRYKKFLENEGFKVLKKY
jgi:DNA-binding transcriptional regulator GbsR (MarR family)